MVCLLNDVFVFDVTVGGNMQRTLQGMSNRVSFVAYYLLNSWKKFMSLAYYEVFFNGFYLVLFYNFT